MYRYPASLRLLGAKSCNWKLSVRIILEHILFWGLFGIYDRAYKSNPIVKEICKLTEGFKLHKSLKNFLFQIPTLNTKCYSNKDEASIYNQTFVYNGQMQKKEELNVYESWFSSNTLGNLFWNSNYIPSTSTANMKTKRTIYLQELFSSVFSKVKRWLRSNYLMKRTLCQQSS